MIMNLSLKENKMLVLTLYILGTMSYAEETSRSLEAFATQSKNENKITESELKENKITESELNRLQQKSIKFIKRH